MMFRIVGTGLACRHSVTLAAVEGDVDLQRSGLKRAVPQLVEDVMGIEGTVVVADPGMVAPDDQMRAAEILANDADIPPEFSRPEVVAILKDYYASLRPAGQSAS